MPYFSKKYNWKGKRMLIVEDMEFIHLYFVEILDETEASYIFAQTGKEALEIFNQDAHIDIILMDIQLPDINGYEVTRKIKEKNRNVPIIAQTAYALAGDKEKALDSGCDDYVSKPIDRIELMDKIDKFLNPDG